MKIRNINYLLYFIDKRIISFLSILTIIYNSYSAKVEWMISKVLYLQAIKNNQKEYRVLTILVAKTVIVQS